MMVAVKEREPENTRGNKNRMRRRSKWSSLPAQVNDRDLQNKERPGRQSTCKRGKKKVVDVKAMVRRTEGEKGQFLIHSFCRKRVCQVPTMYQLSDRR